MTKIVSIFGGSGFIGSYIVKLLAEAGLLIKIICRDPQHAMHLKPCGAVGQIVPVAADIMNLEDVRRHVHDAYAVINLVGILHELDDQSFMEIHAKAAENIAKCAKQSGVKKLIHFSALGIDDNSSSLYARSKIAGEKAVLSAFPEATIAKPSLVFGEESKFFSLFARLVSLLPILPLVRRGETLFQPIYVLDVARFVSVAILSDNMQGKIYELGGNKVYSFKEILRYIIDITGNRCKLLPIPGFLASFFAYILQLKLLRFLLRPLTGTMDPILTVDQVKLLMSDSVVGEGALTLRDVDIEPESLEEIMLRCLDISKR
ncbi:3-beta-hydroxy-Delta(5)-steroid dehydrogenase [Rickettsiales bacterium]|nr:3-beta-hydroxy-Delta(5)-steroid dehydrogenase [Rickettsiales bacterium]